MKLKKKFCTNFCIVQKIVQRPKDIYAYMCFLYYWYDD
jgi:hypothetical protein